MKRNVVFVCAGNTCRSPMAEFILRRRNPDFNVSSAGLMAADGFPMSQHAQVLLQAEGYPIEEIENFTSTFLSDEILAADNEIYVMNSFIKRAIEDRGRRQNVFLLGHDDIADPFGQNLEDYQMVKQIIEEAIEEKF